MSRADPPAYYAPLLAPAGAGGTALDAQTLAVLARVERFTVHQRVTSAEVATCGCCEQPNSYAIIDAASATPIMVAEERSGDIERCCCAPNHSLMLDVFAIGPYGTRTAQVMTIERAGCSRKPGLCCPACGPCCADRATVHAGRVEGWAGEVGTQRALLVVQQSAVCDACLHPTVSVMERAGGRFERYASVSGPCCFGGCSELCFDVPFVAHDGRAAIAKLHPRSLSAALRELVSDSDAYEVALRDPSWTAQQRAGLLSAALLLDYMFFERNGDAIKCEDGARKCNCCNVYLCGCVLPCKCDCSCQRGGSGGGGERRAGGRR